MLSQSTAQFPLQVERMSEHHCSYPQVMDICEALGEPARLHNLMGSCGPPGDFAAYVIKRLHDEGRDSELLKLPRQFDKPILEFLQVPG